MAEQYLRPYLDSSVFLSWIKGEIVNGIDRRAIADHVLSLAGEGSFKIYTSALTLAEVHKLRSGPILPADEGNRLLAFFEHDYIEILTVDRRIGEEAHTLCRQFGIFPNDGIHLACALRAACEVLLAWENRFVRVQHPNIRIEEPQILGQGRLPGMAQSQ